MAADGDQNTLSREEYIARVEKLWQQNTLWPAVLAARSALRVLPVLAAQEDVAKKEHNEPIPPFSYWQPEQRVKHLLAVFFAPLLVLEDSKVFINKGVKKATAAYAAHAADAARVDAAKADATYAARAARAATDARAAAIRVFTYDAYAAADAAARAAYARAAAARAAYAARAAADADLSKAEELLDINQLIDQPLWLASSIPKEIENNYVSNFQPAVKQLISDSQDEKTQSALSHMLVLYEHLLAGASQQTQIKNIFVTREVVNSETARLAENHMGEEREALVTGLVKYLSHDENANHLTIGLLGNWGSGKTRVLDILRERLERKDSPILLQAARHKTNTEHSPFIWGEFNAWAYEQCDNLQAALTHEVISSLTSFSLGVDVTDKAYEKLSDRVFQIYVNLRSRMKWWWQVRLRLLMGFAIRKYPKQVFWSIFWLAIAAWALSYSWVQLSDFSAANDFLSTNSLAGLFTGALGGFGLLRVFQAFRLLSAQTYTKELLTYLKLPDYAKHIGQVNQMREDIRLMCDIALRSKDMNKTTWLGNFGKPKRLVFVIDDLDRCSPQGIVKTFEAVRLILDIPQVTVIIAIDQRIALAALANHYQELAQHHQLKDPKAIARDYFGKMMHLPISLTEPDQTAVEQYMRHLWDEKPDDESVNWQSPFDIWNAKPEVDEPPEPEVGAPPEKAKDSESEETDSELEKELTEQQLANLILNIEEPEASIKIEEKKNFGLTPSQKQAFLYWFDRFHFTNPRQQKRLENTYNLLRLVTGIEDESVGHGFYKNNHKHINNTTETPLKNEMAFGLMLSLFIWEFVNSQENSMIRGLCTGFLNNDFADKDLVNNSELSQGDKKLMFEVADIIKLASQTYKKDYIRIAKNYVLPAIEVEPSD